MSDGKEKSIGSVVDFQPHLHRKRSKMISDESTNKGKGWFVLKAIDTLGERCGDETKGSLVYAWEQNVKAVVWEQLKKAIDDFVDREGFVGAREFAGKSKQEIADYIGACCKFDLFTGECWDARDKFSEWKHAGFPCVAQIMVGMSVGEIDFSDAYEKAKYACENLGVRVDESEREEEEKPPAHDFLASAHEFLKDQSDFTRANVLWKILEMDVFDRPKEGGKSLKMVALETLKRKMQIEIGKEFIEENFGKSETGTGTTKFDKGYEG